MEPNKSLYPMKLKEAPDRFLLVVLEGKTPFFVQKHQPEAKSIVEVLREALDLNKGILVNTAKDDPYRLLHVRLERPEERAAPLCPDRPEMTRAFWDAQDVVPGPASELVRWVTKVPNCSSYRIAFFRSAAFYWVHEQHPRVEQILDVARESINHDVEVQVSLCGTARSFLADLKPKRP
jgi:hypothetical protein